MNNDKIKKGGHLNVGLEWQVDILDPASTFGGWNTARVSRQIYDSLLDDDLENETKPYTEIVPSLVKNYELSEDRTEYTMFLRENVKFTDGNLFDADAVKFNFDRAYNKDAPQYYPVAAGYNKMLKDFVKDIEVIDKYTVKFILNKPFPEFPRYLTQLDLPGGPVILSPEAIKKYGNEGVADKDAGTGPFKLKERFETEFGSAVTLERNPDYWGEEPYLDTITFIPYPHAKDRVEALRTGKVDLIYGPELVQVEDLKKEGFITKKRAVPYLWFFSLNTKMKPLDDIRVRKAILHAFDKEGLSREVFDGKCPAPRGVVVPGSPSYEPDFPDYYEYNPEKAKKLLAEAGYPDGFKFKMLSGGEGSGQLEPDKMCKWLQKDLAKVGIEVEIDIADDWVKYANKWAGGLPEDIGAQEMSWGFNFDFWLEYITHSKYTAPNGGNVGYYNNPEVDRLLDIAHSEADDDLRIELYRIIHRLVVKDAVFLPISNWSEGLVMHNDRVKNFKFAAQLWHSFKKVWIEDK